MGLTTGETPVSRLRQARELKRRHWVWPKNVRENVLLQVKDIHTTKIILYSPKWLLKDIVISKRLTELEH